MGSKPVDPTNRCLLFRRRPNISIGLPYECAKKAAEVAKATGDRLNVVLSKALCAELGVVWEPAVKKLSPEEALNRQREYKRRYYLEHVRGKRMRKGWDYVPKERLAELNRRRNEKNRMNRIRELEAAGQPFVPRGEVLMRYPSEWHALPTAARKKLVHRMYHREWKRREALEKRAAEARDWFERNKNTFGESYQHRRVSTNKETHRLVERYNRAIEDLERAKREESTRLRVVPARTPPSNGCKWPSCGSCAYFATTRSCTCLFEKGGVPTQSEMVCEKYVTFDHSMQFPSDWNDFVDGKGAYGAGAKDVFEKDDTLSRLKPVSEGRPPKEASRMNLRKRLEEDAEEFDKKPSWMSARFWSQHHKAKKETAFDRTVEQIKARQCLEGFDADKVDAGRIARMNEIAQAMKAGAQVPGMEEPCRDTDGRHG